MKRVLVVSLASLTLLVCAISLMAAGKNKANYQFSEDGKTVRAMNPSFETTPGSDVKLTKIAGNLSKDKLAVYFSVFGNTIAQGGSNFPFQTWVANAFTPTANHTVTEIEASVGYLGSGTTGVEVGLYADADGIPGAALESVHVATLPDYGTCCNLAVGKFTTGVPITAGTQYWVAVTTTSKDTDLYGWAFNSTNMTPQLSASWCEGPSTYCGQNSGVWTPYSYVQVGWEVLGQ